MAFLNSKPSFNQIPEPTFKRKKGTGILKSQKYLDLRENFIKAEEIFKKILHEYALFERQQTESKKTYETAKQRCENLETKFVHEKEEAEQNLKMAKEALKTYLCIRKKKLIAEKERLEKELEEAREFYSSRIRPTVQEKYEAKKIFSFIQHDLNQVEEALSFVCNGDHEYEQIRSSSVDSETFRCKRCGYIYIHQLPALWADK